MHRDDIIEYSLDSHHSEEAGIKIRKTIWKVTLYLTLITAFEIGLGIFAYDWRVEQTAMWTAVKVIFILATLVKAAYIVMIFMHLGDERKNFRNFILIPYTIFILYLLVMTLTEGGYQLGVSGLIN
jgi:cytochrome c oxidase subunit 4